MKNKKVSFSIIVVVYAASLALVATPLFGAAVGVSVHLGTNTYIMGQVILGAIFTASFLLNYVVLTYLFAYIKVLTKAIKQVANGDFSIRLTRPHFHPLAATFSDFNKMVSELDSTKIMKEDFISQFSHEFRTPITSINGFANLLLDNKLDHEKQTEYLQVIAEESKRLSRLSTQVMTLTNLENKKIVTNQKTIELDEELRKSIIALLPLIDAKKIKYQLDFEKVKYKSDPELLKEVWLNLLNNSIKFAPENGAIYVCCKKEEDQIKVIIGNNGPQIAEADRKKIFDKFYQGDTTEKHAGLGLGLGIVRQVLILIGGKISIKSSYQKVEGTFFEVIL